MNTCYSANLLIKYFLSSIYLLRFVIHVCVGEWNSPVLVLISPLSKMGGSHCLHVYIFFLFPSCLFYSLLFKCPRPFHCVVPWLNLVYFSKVYCPCTDLAAIFFSANEDCISANHMARILIWRRISLTSRKHLQYVYAHVRVRTMYLKYAPYDWLKYWGMAILVCRKKKSPAMRWSVSSSAADKKNMFESYGH